MAKFKLSARRLLTLLVTGLVSVSIFSLVFATPLVANAATCTNTGSSKFLPDFGSNCVGGISSVSGSRRGVATLIQTIVNYFIFILAAVCVGFIVYGGYLFVTDNGDGSNAGKGKKIVINAIIGLVVALVSYTIVTLVVNFVSSLDISNTGE
ncbi:MAG: hypothetical protein OHK0017_01230 [Patescibacteria group bacterium]